MNNVKFFMTGILLLLSMGIAIGETVVLQQGLNGYSGCEDICMYDDYNDNKPFIHFDNGTFERDNPVFGLGYYKC